MNPIKLAVDTCLQRLGTLSESLQAEYPKLAGILGEVHELLMMIPIELLYLAAIFTVATLLLGFFISPIAGFSTYVERRVAGRMQDRLGCNRVGPEGLFQFLADGIKLVLKEDNIPTGADKPLFILAPYFVIFGSFISFIPIPFGRYLQVADLNVGVFFILAVSSLSVVGILIAGWSSNNKWSVLGAMRSAAQVVSYEIPLGVALMIPVLMTGSLSLQDMVKAQEGSWFIFQAFPAPMIALGVFFIAGLAELNRIPFDLPEAESELVSGYNTEYCGIRWGLFFIGEYAAMFLLGGLASTAFLGGWSSSWLNVIFAAPALYFMFFLGGKTAIYIVHVARDLAKGKNLFDLIGNTPQVRFNKSMLWALGVLSLIMAAFLQLLSDFWLVSFFMFVVKAYFFVFVVIWIRWSLPRVRIDQLMDICWKKLVPIAFGCLFYTALLMAF